MSVDVALAPTATGIGGRLRRSGMGTRLHAGVLRRSLACASPACRTFVIAEGSYCSAGCAHRDAWRRPSAARVVIAAP